MFAKDVILEITKSAQGLNLEPAALLAIADVESAGIAFTTIGGRREPLIRFEAHYFDRRLSEKNRVTAREQGLAAPVAGAIANPKAQAARWRMLEQAAAIDARAAYESVSWGLGQVMGAHWAWLGYASVNALVAEARSGIAGQAHLMCLYIEKAGLAPSLRNHDWATFARGYNGPAYAQSGYHRKLAAAYKTYSTEVAGVRAASSLLRKGSRGGAVADLQRSLTILGYPLAADAVFGPATTNAVKRFQTDHALSADGIVGPKTVAALEAALTSHAPESGFWSRLAGWLARFVARE